MRKYIVELIGTFFLVLTVSLTGNPIAIGAVLAALIYMGGYISGAHYNPAVTTALLFLKKITFKTALVYILMQLIGGFLAAVAYYSIKETKFLPTLGTGVTVINAMMIEILFTFLLISVILHVAATKETKTNQYFGLAIGLALMVGAFAGGPISGGVFNPAVAIGPMVFDYSNLNTHFANLLIYISGPILGGILAALIYRI